MPSMTGEKSNQVADVQGPSTLGVRLGKAHPKMNSAEAKNESAFRMNTASRPRRAATAPPRAAPIMRFSDQRVEDRVFAKTTSSFPRCLGITSFARFKKRSQQGFRNQQRIHHHTTPFERTNSMQKTIACAQVSDDHHMLAAQRC